MAIYVSDTFTEASDTALESHTPNVGGTWNVWVGGITVESGGNCRDNGSSNWNRANMGSIGATVYDISANITCPGTLGQYIAPGIGGRHTTTSAADGYEFIYNRDTETFQLKENGTVVSSSAEAWPGDGALMLLSIRASEVVGYVNGVQKVTVATSINATSQIVSLILANFSGTYLRARADNFLAQDAVVPQIPRLASGVGSG